MHIFSFLFLLVPFTTIATSVLTISVPSSALLPKPNALPPSTHATLTTLSPSIPALRAPLSRSSTFVFRNLSAVPASYLLEIYSRDFLFAPYRVDIGNDGRVAGVWETYRGNAWENKGADKVVGRREGPEVGKENMLVEAKVLAKRGFYEERPKFSPLALLKNPMILLAVFALAITFGFPYLLENMDPEMRAEFEKQSRSSPLAGASRSALSSGVGSSGGAGAASFDLAGWMAGTSQGPLAAAKEASAERATTSARDAGAGGASSGRRRG